MPDRTQKTTIGLFSTCAIIAVAGIAGLVIFKPWKSSPESPKNSPAENQVDFANLKPDIEKFCGDCHATPDPATFPRDAWYDEVAQGYRFYRESMRTDLKSPPMSEVVAYYRSLAQEQLNVALSDSVDSPRIRFELSTIPAPIGVRSASVSDIHAIESLSGRPTLISCDMKSGSVQTFEFRPSEVQSESFAQLAHPAHVESTDLNQDGITDYVVADLGSFLPEDHDKGQVLWLRPDAGDSKAKVTVLLSGIGRVADVQPADFDSDGDLDLVVAEFGWRRTGRILLMEQIASADGIPQFDYRVIDKRHGTIHVPVTDLNNDGHPDFVALVSQEHEVIDAFINNGQGGFQQQAILTARDPSFGSSGIQLVDLDRDNDIDVVYTNGDSLDSHILKPYHGVHWLENCGDFPFKHHHLTHLPGASHALARDMDNDGDLDIVAAAFLPESLLDSKPAGSFDTLVILEQSAGGDFERFRLENEMRGHLAIELADIDGDHDADIAVGNHGGPGSESPVSISIWQNLTN